MRNNSFVILSGVDTGNVTGSKVDTGQVVSASFQIITGDVDAAGTVKIQMSNDAPPSGNLNTFTPTNWSDVANATSTVASGVGPPITIAQMCYRWVRAIYTRSGGGSTTITVQMNVLSL